MNFIAISLALQATAIAAPPSEAAATVRRFLDAMATRPAAARAMATTDAIVIAGDIGIGLAEFMHKVRPRAVWLNDCRVDSLELKPTPPQSQFDDAPELLRHGKLAVMDATYLCATGSEPQERHVRVVLRDGKVAMFMLLTGDHPPGP